MGALAKVPNTRMMALCDVYDPNLELAQKLAEPKAVTTRDYHALLGRKDVKVYYGSIVDWTTVPSRPVTSSRTKWDDIKKFFGHGS